MTLTLPLCHAHSSCHCTQLDCRCVPLSWQRRLQGRARGRPAGGGAKAIAGAGEESSAAGRWVDHMRASQRRGERIVRKSGITLETRRAPPGSVSTRAAVERPAHAAAAVPTAPGGRGAGGRPLRTGTAARWCSPAPPGAPPWPVWSEAVGGRGQQGQQPAAAPPQHVEAVQDQHPGQPAKEAAGRLARLVHGRRAAAQHEHVGAGSGQVLPATGRRGRRAAGTRFRGGSVRRQRRQQRRDGAGSRRQHRQHQCI